MQWRLYADDVDIYVSLVDGNTENDDDGHLLCWMTAQPTIDGTSIHLPSNLLLP